MDKSSLVRLYLDYGDIIYHIPHNVCEFSHSAVLTDGMENLESVQYSAASAVGVSRVTAREAVMMSFFGNH